MTDTDPALYFDDDGTPRSARFGDIYYSPQDGLSETRTVFLQGCGLPERWEGRSGFTVLELGFGTGLNLVALMQLWAQTRAHGARLNIFTVEAFLMPRESAARALANWPDLSPFTEAVLSQWPPARHGLHVIDFPQWGVRLTVALMPATEALAQWDFAADAIFLDGFSPALNPDMWSDSIMAEVGRLSAPAARVGTFTVAGHVRRALSSAGFQVAKAPGYGRKRERLEAIFPGERVTQTVTRRVAIVGAGIAGASACYYARMAGLDVEVFDADGIGSGASGNAAALVTPRLDAGANAISSLFADAFYHSTALYARLCPDAIIGSGVHLPQDQPKALQRLERIAAQPYFASGDLMPGSDGLFQARALYVRPDKVLAALLDGVEVRHEIVSPEPVDGGWSIGGGTYNAVIMACGEGLFSMPDSYSSGFSAVRGQVEFAPITPPARALSGDGYVIPLPEGVLFGATHDRGDRGRDTRLSSQTENLSRLHRLTGLTPEAGVLSSRASIRVTTRDYLPVVGEVAPGLWLMAGMGARGFCLSPWLGLSLVARLGGQGDPVGTVTRKVIAPQRAAMRRHDV